MGHPVRSIILKKERHLRALRLPAILLALMTGASLPLAAQERAQPVAWPCAQIFVPAVSASVLWAGPSMEALKPQAWRGDKATARLVRDITSQFTDSANIEAMVSTYVKRLAPDQKDQKLTLVFFGVLDVLNLRRTKYMNGILKYSRQQSARAKVIDDGLAELVRLKAANGSDEQVKELENKLSWQNRMFDDRERSIQFLCEQPVNVEVVMADLARTLSYELE